MPAPKPIVGLLFTRAHWTREDGRPLVCRVTAVRRGAIYYRPTDGGRSECCAPDRWPHVWGGQPPSILSTPKE